MHSLFLKFGILYLGHVITALPTQRAISDGPFVEDSVLNVSYHGTSSNGVDSFLNIRFGRDTSGSNRFAAPKPFVYPHGAIVNATTPGAACPQQKVPIPGLPIFDNITNVSEDCLSLRIDRPANTTVHAKLPVLLWVFGGGDTIGQIYDSAYDPTNLILSSVFRGLPVIYAAMNYRLGFFGFSAFADNTTDAVPNAGLLDQRLAMEWIQQHVVLFGGDPDNVTIYGESDGATGVGLQITAYGGKQSPPFRRAIMESSSATADPGTTSNQTWLNTQEMTKALDCSNADNNLTLSIACLRNISLDKMLPVEVNFTYSFDSFSGLDTFFPVVDNAFVPAAPSQLLLNGNFSKNISIINGWNENDGSLFAGSPDSFSNATYLSSWILSEFPNLNESEVERVLSVYPADSSTFAAQRIAYPDIPVDWMRASQIVRDTNDVCPALLMAQAVAKYNIGNPDVMAYLYSLNASLYTPFLDANNASYLGITHFSDIPFVFDQAAAFNASESLTALASEISGSWIQFAYSGRPSQKDAEADTSPALALSDWPIATSELDSEDVSNGRMIVKIIGGDSSSVVKVGPRLTTDDDYQEIGRRCAFWNNPDMLAGISV